MWLQLTPNLDISRLFRIKADGMHVDPVRQARPGGDGKFRSTAEALDWTKVPIENRFEGAHAAFEATITPSITGTAVRMLA
jgi:hypothetical protein